ncbi:MAG: amino acid adenylation domain-containing protein [Oribacterium sp.]|nr:amino acid adenylation domain-containing protein [Oribacterium sp.]
MTDFYQSGATITIMIKGRLDASNANDVQTQIVDKLEHSEFESICFDMSDLEYISSAGLRILLIIRHKYGDLRIINTRAAVYDVFYVTGMNEMFGIKPPENYLNESEVMEEIETGFEQRPSERTHVPTGNNTPKEPLDGINDTREDFPYVSVIEMFLKQVKKHPDKIAVVSPDAALTYAQLDELSNKVANILLFLGVMPDDVIMIMLPRSVDVYVATLGVMKAGAAYTIVNVKYPDDRIEYIYNDSGCKYMISNNPTVMDRLELIADVLKKRPLFMEALLSYSDSSDPEIRISSDSLCYLIYTSGSTGKPKGVMIEHGSLTNFVYPTPKNYEANGITQKGNVLLAMAQMTFDVSVMEEYLGLTSGMTVALATENEIMDPSAMKKFMLNNRVDAVCFTPAYANTLLSIPDMKEAIRGIVTYDFGAEAFPGALFTKIRAINPDAYIMNGYGPTEATISCTMKVIESPDNITIGKPNANVYVFVADEELKEVPKGEIGELLVCGLGVGRGYCNLPEKTSESFVTFNGMRAYRTGDLVCINENDEIEYHGRRDNQVKLRGLRIELDEVEKVIASHPAVKNCAAKVFDNRILVGYYELLNYGEVSPDDVKEFARKQLAHYMVPDVFEEVEQMPLTPNNKIDRKSLLKPQIKEEETVPPENEVQAYILAVLKEIIGDDNIGITTNIIDLGLSSLDAMILVAKLEEKFQVDVKFVDIYDNPTVAMMEKMLSLKPKRRDRQAKERYVCHSTIASAYQMVAADPTSTQWNLPYLYFVDRNSVDAERLKGAVIDALKAHPGLWARFESKGETVYMLPATEEYQYDIPVVNMTQEEFEERKKTLVRPIHLDAPVLFRAEMFITEINVYLFLDISHIIIDGESFDILLSDIDKAYRGEKLTPENYTMFDAVDDQDAFFEDGGKETSEKYYEDLFASAGCKTSFRKDKEDGTPISATRYDRKLKVSREDIQRITKTLRISETVLFMGLLSACVAADSGSRAAYYPMAYNGRNDARAHSTIGFLAQMVMVLSSWDDRTTVKDYLQSIQKQIIYPMGFTCQPYLEMLTRYPELLIYAFSFIGEENDTYPLGDGKLKYEALSPEGSGGMFGIFQEIKISDGKYICSSEYRSNELNEQSLVELMDIFEGMIENFDPDMKVDDLLKKSEK